jgi:hypothetical protein
MNEALLKCNEVKYQIYIYDFKQHMYFNLYYKKCPQYNCANVIFGSILNETTQQITNTDKKLHPKRQMEPRKTTEETSRCVRPERVNKWPNFLIAM